MNKVTCLGVNFNRHETFSHPSGFATVWIHRGDTCTQYSDVTPSSMRRVIKAQQEWYSKIESAKYKARHEPTAPR